jgi:hypothetical protein
LDNGTFRRLDAGLDVFDGLDAARFHDAARASDTRSLRNWMFGGSNARFDAFAPAVMLLLAQHQIGCLFVAILASIVLLALVTLFVLMITVARMLARFMMVAWMIGSSVASRRLLARAIELAYVPPSSLFTLLFGRASPIGRLDIWRGTLARPSARLFGCRGQHRIHGHSLTCWGTPRNKDAARS